MLFRRVRAEFSDGVIDLLPLRLYPPEKEMGFGRVYDYMIVPHGKSSVVITTDPDNWASRKTCLGLGCTLERTVAVPQEIRDRWEISAVKCRYIWRIDG